MKPTIEEHTKICVSCLEFFQTYGSNSKLYFINEDHHRKYGTDPEEFPSQNEWHLAYTDETL